jgi:phosphopantetheinyl transferase (holo-ACP synthase)
MFRTDTIQITPDLLTLLTEIDEFKGAWRALGSLAPDRLIALRRVATIESVGSSTRIEDSKLSDREVERLLTDLEIKKFESRDEQEVAGYAAVIETVIAAWQHIPINENHIKQLHRDLLRYSDKDERHRGEYKKKYPTALPPSMRTVSKLVLYLRRRRQATRRALWLS